MAHWYPSLSFLPRILAFGLIVSAVGGSPGRASAAIDDMGDDEESVEEPAAEGETEATEGEPTEGAGEAKAQEGEPGAQLASEAWDREALQFEVGARGRLMVVPKFLINAFGVEGADTLVVGGIGGEGGISKGPFEGLLGIWYAGYNTSTMPFKGPSDPPEGWEMIKSNLGVLYITADLMFRGKIATDWNWYLGAGLGVGVVTGTLQRNETYWATGPGGTPGPAGDPYTQLALCPVPVGFGTVECPGPINGDNRYDLVSVPPTSSSVWPVYPWVTYQMGVRYQPIKHFIARFDLGVGSSGFWLGLGADYGI
jgi:hypothetical protein